MICISNIHITYVCISRCWVAIPCTYSCQNTSVQAVISKSPVTATIDAPCSLNRCQSMPQAKLPTYIDATEARQASAHAVESLHKP